MQFRLSTLGIVIAWFAVAFAFGKAGGAESFLMFLNVSGFVVPIFIANIWLRMGVAFVVTTLTVDAMLAIILWALDQDGLSSLSETALYALPSAAIAGLIAVAFSSVVRWLAILIYRDVALIRSKRLDASASQEK